MLQFSCKEMTIDAHNYHLVQIASGAGISVSAKESDRVI